MKCRKSKRIASRFPGDMNQPMPYVAMQVPQEQSGIGVVVPNTIENVGRGIGPSPSRWAFRRNPINITLNGIHGKRNRKIKVDLGGIYSK